MMMNEDYIWNISWLFKPVKFIVNNVIHDVRQWGHPTAIKNLLEQRATMRLLLRTIKKTVTIVNTIPESDMILHDGLVHQQETGSLRHHRKTECLE